MKPHNRILLAILALALLAAAAAVYAFGKDWLEERLKAALVERGLEEVSFSIDTLGLAGITLRDISFGGKVPLAIDRLTMDYSIFELLKRQVREIDIDRLTVEENNIDFTLSGITLAFEDTEGAERWRGGWAVKKAGIVGAPLDLPPLAGAGSFDLQQGKLSAEGELKSADATHRAVFRVAYDTQAPAGSLLVIESASLPWQGGKLATQNARIALGGGRASTMVLEVERVSLDALLQLMTGKRATATGVVSGRVPVTIRGDGDIAIHAGSLKAEDPGTIALTPDAIPGEGEQVGLVRDILKNFRYRKLAISLDGGENEKLSMLLQLSGNNPDVYNGKEINLNVRLTGDVLSFLQQSVVPLADPKKLLEQ